jgi:hypothetical protein
MTNFRLTDAADRLVIEFDAYDMEEAQSIIRNAMLNPDKIEFCELTPQRSLVWDGTGSGTHQLACD